MVRALTVCYVVIISKEDKARLICKYVSKLTFQFCSTHARKKRAWKRAYYALNPKASKFIGKGRRSLCCSVLYQKIRRN